MNELGKWKHKLTNEIIEIKLVRRELFIHNLTKNTSPFLLSKDWNKWDYYEKLNDE